MSIATTSVLEALLEAVPELHPQMYFKSPLTALSHAMEDQVLAGVDTYQDYKPLIIANFQKERFYRQESHRYKRIAAMTPHVYILAAAETEFAHSSDFYETIAFSPEDSLGLEWHLVIISQNYASCLICQERQPTSDVDLLKKSASVELSAMDQSRRFEGIWTLDQDVSRQAAIILFDKILAYRPELKGKINEALELYGMKKRSKKSRRTLINSSDLGYLQSTEKFAQRLATYLQAGQHKLIKAYRTIAIRERKERLTNLIATAIRRSLNPQEICEVAVNELGQALSASRCILYRCKVTDSTATILHEFINRDLSDIVMSLAGQAWPLQNNPVFHYVVERLEGVYMNDFNFDKQGYISKCRQNFKTKISSFDLVSQKKIQKILDKWHIVGWMMVPILYQGKLLGVVELHQCGSELIDWELGDLELVDAISTQLGATLIQAETYANLEELNQQLEALDRTRSNLIAITGHELRTPLSTIQVCLESLASEPDMPLELRQVMLDTALSDAERMRKLVQDFLTLSHLESGTVNWNFESLPLQECLDLAMSSLKNRNEKKMPKIRLQVPKELPLVQTDGEWLVEVISKLLDNACKFTKPEGMITIKAKRKGDRMLEVTISDTGRGIEPNRLEVVFDRFYQEEGALQRTVGGTGLGLAICRQIITRLGGEIWAESNGKDQGTKFYFTIPISDSINGK